MCPTNILKKLYGVCTEINGNHAWNIIVLTRKNAFKFHLKQDII